MYTRHSTIRSALSTTCEWFLTDESYLAWSDPQKFDQHHGFLWISGKPGSGKSTLMKFLLAEAETQRNDQIAILSFFFNARGHTMERSVLGIYRSLVYQLLTAFPDLQALLRDPRLSSHISLGFPSLETLRDILEKAVSLLADRSFIAFVDALDECNEDEVRDMVGHFEELCQKGLRTNTKFRVCFSSRHYPYVQLKRGIRILLEASNGHKSDLKTYIREKLQTKQNIPGEHIRQSIFDKAAGTFMWVVLVIDILNKELNRGRVFDVERRLQRFPTKLNSLLRDICTRDNEYEDEFKLCLQWLLFSQRRLNVSELYCAICWGRPDSAVLVPRIPKTDAVRFIISSSKGLAEIVQHKSQEPEVQFIHESVRDFLTKEHGFAELWPSSDRNITCQSHEKLKEYCYTYILAVEPVVSQYLTKEREQSSPEASRRMKKVIAIRFPFYQYAIAFILVHADMACPAIPQADFLRNFAFETWVAMDQVRDSDPIWGCQSEEKDRYAILAKLGLFNLLKVQRRLDSGLIEDPRRYARPAIIALTGGNRDATRVLLGLDDFGATTPDCYARVRRQDPSLMDHQWPKMRRMSDGEKSLGRGDGDWLLALYRASEQGSADMLSSLIEEAFESNYRVKHRKPRHSPTSNDCLILQAAMVLEAAADSKLDGNPNSMLCSAVTRGFLDMVVLLFFCGADIDQDHLGQCPLHFASKEGNLAMVKLLVMMGAQLEIEDSSGLIPFTLASQEGHVSVAELLFHSTYINSPNTGLQTRLRLAARNGDVKTVQVLIRMGVNVNATDSKGRDALIWALESVESRRGGAYNCMRTHVVRQLLLNGADPNASQDERGHGAFFVAVCKYREDCVRLLLQHGANVNSLDREGSNALLLVCSNYRDPGPKIYSMIQLLSEMGIDVNKANNSGRTPLSYLVGRLPEPYWEVDEWASKATQLLINKGADLNLCDHEGRAPLSYACTGPVTSVLLKEGADVHHRDKTGGTALMWARSHASLETAIQLVAGGSNIHAQNRHGRNALMVMVAEGFRLDDRWIDRFARFLLEQGVSVHTKDHAGLDVTAIWASMEQGHIHGMPKLLVEFGADVSRVSDAIKYRYRLF